MASFIGNLFPAGKQSDRPGTPSRNNFITPASTPQGSPSKKTVPPGANELPDALGHLKLAPPPAFDSPLKLSRPQSVVASATPLAPTWNNAQVADDSSVFVDDSVLHKSGASPASYLRKQGQENTPPPLSTSRHGNAGDQHGIQSHAALSRQEMYTGEKEGQRERERHRPTTPAAATKRFNTSRGLTAEELEILQKPNVKRMVNVTQLCMFRILFFFRTLPCGPYLLTDPSRLPRLLL